MSSGSETRQRGQRFPAVRCTAEEAAAIRAAVAQSGLSYAALVRKTLTGSVGPRTPRKRIDRVELCRILGETGMIGSNVNQMARVANSGGELPSVAALERIWKEVSEIRSALMKALGRGD